jgi:hypothetical protein
MTPEIGKWYAIAYGKSGSKRAYHGKAKCLGRREQDNGWYFRRAEQPEDQNVFSYMLFRECDIVGETTAEPTYAELAALVAALQDKLKEQ